MVACGQTRKRVEGHSATLSRIAPAYLHLAEWLEMETGCALYIVLVKRRKDLRGAARWEKVREGVFGTAALSARLYTTIIFTSRLWRRRRRRRRRRPRQRLLPAAQKWTHFSAAAAAAAAGKIYNSLSLDTTFAAMQEGGKGRLEKVNQ